MEELLQTIADGLFTFLLIFETFLDTIDNIDFLDSGYSLLVFFYSFALVQFIVGLFNNFIIGDAYDDDNTVDFVEICDSNNILEETIND
jgi:hypothetical protein